MADDRAVTALESFLAERGEPLLRTAVLLTGGKEAGEDLLQAGLERLLRHWSAIDGDPEGYLRRTLYNLAADGWRRQRAWRWRLRLLQNETVTAAADATTEVDAARPGVPTGTPGRRAGARQRPAVRELPRHRPPPGDDLPVHRHPAGRGGAPPGAAGLGHPGSYPGVLVSVATHSTWWVMGNASNARSAPSSHPASANSAMSRASVAGSHDT